MNIQIICLVLLMLPGINNRSEQTKKNEVRTPRPVYTAGLNQPGNQSGGNKLFAENCLTCHQEDGKGVRGTFPPLAGNPKITGPSDELIKIVLSGLDGPIVVNETDYDQAMPPQNYLNDKQIADILTYIRNAWGNKASPINSIDVGKVRKQLKL
jgi:mono/diheme cytochrome c family protein